MSKLLATHPSDCCAQAVKHTGTAVGSFVNIGGVETYVSYAPDKSLDRVLLFYCDVFGPRFLNNQLVADWFAEHGYTVLSPDYFEGQELEKLMGQPEFNIMEWVGPFRASAPKLVDTEAFRGQLSGLANKGSQRSTKGLQPGLLVDTNRMEISAFSRTHIWA